MLFADTTVSGAVSILAAIISALGSSLVTAAITRWRQRGQLHADVKAIREQVFSNGGSSLRDAVDRIADELHVEREIRRATSQHAAVPLWEADANGNIFWCNASFAKLLGVSTEDLKDHGWLSMVAHDDLARVKHEILQSGSHDHHVDYRVHLPGVITMLHVKTRWKRVTGHTGKTVRYVGTVISHEQVKGVAG